MEIHRSDSEEIQQYNIALSRCQEINGCVEEILFSLKNLQLKFTMPTINTKIKVKKGKSTTHSKRAVKCDIPKLEKTFLSRRSLYLIAQMSSDFILKSIKIKREFEGSLKQLEFVREKYDRKIRFYATQSVFIRSNLSCKCLSRLREK